MGPGTAGVIGSRCGGCSLGRDKNILSPVTLLKEVYGPDSCQRYCSRMKYAYAGLRNGNECWCHDWLGPEALTDVDPSNCNVHCRDSPDPWDTCGGETAMQWYTRDRNVPGRSLDDFEMTAPSCGTCKDSRWKAASTTGRWTKRKHWTGRTSQPQPPDRRSHY